MPIFLSPDDAEKKGHDLTKLIDGDIQQRSVLMNRRKYIREIYHGHQERMLEEPGESNIHLNVMTEKIENTTPQILNSFWQADPIVHVKRVEEEFDPELTRLNERFLNWAIDSDIPNFYAIHEQWIRNMLIDGTSVLKTYWKHEMRNGLVIESLKRVIKAGEAGAVGEIVSVDRIKRPDELLLEQFDGTLPVKALLAVTPIGDSVHESTELDDVAGQSYLVSFVEDREEYQNVRVDFVASRYIDEIELHIMRPIVVCDQPVIENIEFESLILPYRTTDLQTAERVIQEYWLTIDEVKNKIATEGWEISDEDMDALRSSSRSEDRHEQHPENKALRRQKDRHIGEQNPGRRSVDEAAYVDDKVLIYEMYLRDDVDGDGFAEEVIYHMPRRLRKIVKGYYLEELFPHGRRPFADLHHIRISDRWYSLGMGELLAPINVEANAIINMVNDAQELINHPFFFYVPSANTVDPQVIRGVKPGEGIPIAERGAIEFPQWTQQPLANLSAMDSILLFADRLTLSPQAAGSSQVRNAPRTARGTLALLSEGAVKTDMIITAAQRGGWRELIHQIHALYAHYGSDEKWFQSTGTMKRDRITTKELRGRFDYRFSGNSVNTNREVMRSIAQIRWQMFAGDPQLLQDPEARLELMRNTMEHFSEGIDVSRVMPRSPSAGGSHPPLDQATETRMILQGVPVEALLLDNHTEHIAELDRLSGTKEFEQLDQWQVAMLAQHKQQHVQMLLSQQAQGGLAGGPGAGAVNNVPTDLGDLEGGVQ
jgi:hypothetical protein